MRVKHFQLLASLTLSLSSMTAAPLAAQATRPGGEGMLAPGVSKTDTMAIPVGGGSRAARPTPDRASDRAAAATNPGSAQVSAPAAATPNSIGFDLTRMAVALVIVLALIFFIKWFFGRMFAGSRAPAASRAIKVLGRTSLAPRQQVLLLQVGRRVIVVGESNGNLATLANLDDPDEVATLVGQLQQEQIARAASFGGLFGRAERRFEEQPIEESPPPAASPSRSPDEAQVRSELSGLVDKVRSIRSSLGSDLDVSR